MTNGEAIPESWRAALEPVLQNAESRRLGGWLRQEEERGTTIYPPRGQRLRALELTPLDAVKVVILGQDPYHGPGQAHGLCFSVNDGVQVPPSLVNIYKELESDLGVPRRASGNLEHWGRQGVLLHTSNANISGEQKIAYMRKQVVERQKALSLFRPFHPGRRPEIAVAEQAAEPAPAEAVLRIGDDVRRSIGEDEARADRELERPGAGFHLGLQILERFSVGMFLPAILAGRSACPHFLRRGQAVFAQIPQRAPRTHHASKRVAVIDTDDRQPQFARLTLILLRMRRAMQEREIGGDADFAIGRNVARMFHANSPCTNHRVGTAAPLSSATSS